LIELVPPSEVRIQLPERYRVVRHVANGGMAAVWSAEDAILGRLVAVKILAQHVAADPSARTRFEREARTAARVSDHPNVVTIYDVGEHDDVPFIVMELFTGGSVADRVRDGLGSVPRTRALAWLEQAAAALDYAHGEGIVHRDIKPANLLLDDRERLAVGDFGIARAAEDSSLTQAGQVLGTAAYLSPEQALGQDATPASDRYSLAVVAYELLAGRRPFQGEHIAAQARQHVEGEMPSTGLGDDVDAVICRAMAKDPDDRSPTSARFVEELRAVTAAGAQAAPPAPPTEATRRVAATPPPRAAAAAPPPPPPRTPSRPLDVPPQRGGGGNRRAWALGLAALLVLAIAAGAVALVTGNDGGSGSESPRAGTQAAEPQQTQAQEEPQTQQEQAPPADEAQPPAETAPDTEGEGGAGPSASGESPSALNDEGYSLLQNGQADQAVPILQRSVQGFEAQGDGADPTTYGYALYNLGTALVEAGRPAEAIPYFERRLQVSPDDRPNVVRKAIKDAEKAAGGQGGGDGDDG
jgi:eukaryotic-like serine/threonine-protein kinase